ncbi:MAG: Slp family lipoprotein [Nitrospirales bacterium]|nr:Slp family lipoprotein [Nitrospirales bacterium]
MNGHLRKMTVWGFALLAGCASGPEAIPDSLKSHIDSQASFQEILQQPETFQGKLVVLGGEVLHAKRSSEATQLEILQLPLDGSNRPSSIKTDSQGRFLAFEHAFLDPATFPPGTRVTVVGKVTGGQTAQLDEMTYQYPTLAIKHLHVWNHETEELQGASGPWYGIFGGGSTGGRVGGGVGIGIGF